LRREGSGTYTLVVATPTFSPAAGNFTSAPSVTISTTTSGATIRYTTDGSTPSETAGTVYSGAVSISSTTTLKAIAYETGMTDSSVASGTYTISGGGGNPPSFVQVKDNVVSSGSSVAATFTSATTAGNTIVVYVIWDNAGTASVTDSRGDNFTSVSAPVVWDGGFRAQIFYATNIAGGTDTVTATFQNAVSSFGSIYVHEYSGISTTNPVDVTASASGSGGTLNSGSATTTTANDLIFGAGVSDANVSAAGSGFTTRDTASGNITEDKTAATTGSYSATATHTGQNWGVQMVAFRPAH
jgi:hypothetical protein